MNPITLGVIALLGLGLASGKKKRRRGARPPVAPVAPCDQMPPTETAPYGWTANELGNCVPAAEPAILWDGESWMIPDVWWEYITPKFQAIVAPMIESEVSVDPMPVAWEILIEETGPFQLPPSPYPAEGGEFWQTDVSFSPDFYDGPDSVIGLLYHISDYVTDALDRFDASGDLYLGA